MLPYESYVDVMAELDRMVVAFESHPDPATRETAMALLNGLDLLHREGLHRLVAALRERGGGELVDGATAEDPVVRAFLGLYDLADLDLPAEEGDGAAASGPPGPGPRPASPPPTGFVPLSRLRVRGEPVGEKEREDGPEGDG